MINHSKVDILKFSEYIIRYFNSVGEIITNKKLNIILYYLQAWYLTYFDTDIFENEILPEAWVCCPIYHNIYLQYKNWEDNPIQLLDEECLDRKILVKNLEDFQLSKIQEEFLDSFLNNYGKKSEPELEFMVHTEEPWIEARGDLKPFEKGNTLISLETIKNYFKKKIKKI